MHILLVGTGWMARQYVPALRALKADIRAVGRGIEKATIFAQETGVETVTGGTAVLPKPRKGERAIVTVHADQTVTVTLRLIALGYRHILVEKPGALTARELKRLERAARATRTQVYIAYNRRFYSVVQEARARIEADGGPLSLHFQFNERLNQRESLPARGIPKVVQNSWFIANATHVLDLAFFLGGMPKKLNSGVAAGPLWAPQPTLFSGAGITERGAQFFYYSNWELAGPWSLEVSSQKRKLILAPLETLREEIDGVTRDVVLSDTTDTTCKAGVHQETESFLTDQRNLPTITDQLRAFPWYEKIRDGTF